MNEFAEATKEFLLECHENLGQLDQDLVELEKLPADSGILSRIFRTLHTIKGSCAFLGFQKLRAVAHAGETLLGRLRDGSGKVSEEIISALLNVVDAIRDMLASIEIQGHDGSNDYAPLQAELAKLSLEAAAANPSDLPLTQVVPAPAAQPQPHSKIPSRPAAQSQIAAAVETPPQAATAPAAADSATSPLSVAKSAASTAGQEATPAPFVADSTVRLDVQLLDKLMMLVSELVLSRNQILQHGNSADGSTQGGAGFQAACRQLNLITSELQEQVMKTRLQPISNIWNRFPRLVRDVALECGRQVRLEMEGSETELDKTIIEAVRDPLTHLVRNAVDHGIETPQQRLAAGKPAAGCVWLRAFHEGGQVNIEVSDDGTGMDLNRIRRRAIERNLILPQQADQLDDQTLLNMVFLPGFSTVERVTSVSGRGVGMDVVKANIEKIGGNVDIQSRAGQGTTIKMRIPLTLAIIKALVVTTAGDRYAIPQVSIVELVRLEGAKARKSIERIQGAPVYRFRGKLLPIVFLDRVLHVAARGDSNSAHPSLADWATNWKEIPSFEDQTLNIAVLQAGQRQFGLVVEQINDAQEIVVKPLWQKLKGISCFAGATIMGDGNVALILDVFGLAQQAHVVSKLPEHELGEAKEPVSLPRDESHGFVLAEDSDRSRIAIPLSKVARLEKFPRGAIERLGDRYVVQYRRDILPLVDVPAMLQRRVPFGWLSPTKAERSDATVQIVVYTREGRSIGLIVDHILDIFEQVLTVKSRATRDNVLFSTIIQEHVTEFLDVEQLIRSVYPSFFDSTVAEGVEVCG